MTQVEKLPQNIRSLQSLPDLDEALCSIQNNDDSAQLASAKAKKRSKIRSKTQKVTIANVRPGDWVCLVCSNLNFSFRNDCNRCQSQTKSQNYNESVRLLNQSRKFDVEQLPFKENTNNGSPLNPSEPAELKQKSRSSPLTEILDINVYAPPGLEPHSLEYLDTRNSDSDFQSNSGFESVILLTPPKISRGKELTFFKEYSDIKQRDFQAYKSPSKLPSVSPILKNILNDENIRRQRTTSIDGYDIPKALSFVNEVLYNEEDDFKQNQYYQSGDDTIDSEKAYGNSDGQEADGELDESEEREMELLCENILQDLQLNMDEEIIKLEEMQKSNTRASSKTEITVDRKGVVEEASKKPKKERKADWVCGGCGNLNYSFRKVCNRCQVAHKAQAKGQQC